MSDLMPYLGKLRQEHAQLVEIASRLSAAVAAPQPPAATELFMLRNELTSILIAHLKAEDWLLYPRLLASPDPSVKKTARAFSDEMGGLAQAYGCYTHKWTAMSIQVNWVGYCKETRDIIDALTQRIARENRELYPLLDTMEKAA